MFLQIKALHIEGVINLQCKTHRLNYLLLSIWRKITRSYSLWNSFFRCDCYFIVLLAPKYPEVANNTSTSKLKRNVAPFFSFICNEHLFIQTGLFFCFVFVLFWFVLFMAGWVGSFVYCYVGSLVFSYPLITDTCMWIQSMWNLYKQDAKMPHRFLEKKKANEISSVDYQIQNI